MELQQPLLLFSLPQRRDGGRLSDETARGARSKIDEEGRYAPAMKHTAQPLKVHAECSVQGPHVSSPRGHCQQSGGSTAWEHFTGVDPHDVLRVQGAQCRLQGVGVGV